MDFTFKTYIQLLESLKKAGYHFQTYAEYVSKPVLEIPSKCIMLRHDVEAHYENALRMAIIQNEQGIKGTFYFRIFAKSFQSEVVKQIAHLGHEIGYHYDDLAVCKGDYEKAIKRFEAHLNRLRELAPVKTITMDGSPLSRYDNRKLWSKYDYKALGILAEPYFDLDFNAVFYITDTGRRWDGHLFNVRDKATDENPLTNPEFLNLRFHSTADLIRAIERRGEMETRKQGDKETKGQGDKETRGQGDKGTRGQGDKGTRRQGDGETRRPLNTESGIHKTTSASASTSAFPSQAMLNFHPQRWNSNPYLWTKELILQNAKNQVKRFLVKR